MLANIKQTVRSIMSREVLGNNTLLPSWYMRWTRAGSTQLELQLFSMRHWTPGCCVKRYPQKWLIKTESKRESCDLSLEYFCWQRDIKMVQWHPKGCRRHSFCQVAKDRNVFRVLAACSEYGPLQSAHLFKTICDYRENAAHLHKSQPTLRSWRITTLPIILSNSWNH